MWSGTMARVVSLLVFQAGAGFVLSCRKDHGCSRPACEQGCQRQTDGTRRTGVGCSLSLPARRIPVVYEQRWVSELLEEGGHGRPWRFVGGGDVRRES
jgi:hypothetical protein